MDPQFQELAREIADAIVKRLSGDADKKLRGAFEDSEDSEARVKKHLDECEKRLESKMQMHVERLEGTIKLTGEAHAATLQGIERRLAEINKQFEPKAART